MTYFRRNLITSSIVTLFALLVPFAALAQKQPCFGSGDSDRRDGRARSTYKSSYAISNSARRLAYRSQSFQWRLERELNFSYLDGTSREKRANQLSRGLHQAAETLSSLFARGRSVENSATEAGNIFRLGKELDDFLARAPVSPATLSSWDAITRELSLLATAYEFDAAAVDGTVTEDSASAVVDYQPAAMSYGRIWSWAF